MKESKYVKLSKVFLDLENPRHQPFTSEREAIAHLWAEEQVLNLAKDIATNGLSDFETPALVKDSKGTYKVVEGNRRICALKLLSDPELAPDEKSKNQMRKLVENWEPLTEILAVVYDSADDDNLLLWREKTHLGQDEGRGRKAWSAQAKQRHTKLDKYATAAAILTYAVAKGWITPEEREQVRISTLQRVLDNRFFKTMTGLRVDDVGLKTDLDTSDFDQIFHRLVTDVSTGRINTRQGARTAEEMETYSKEALPQAERVVEWYIHNHRIEVEPEVRADRGQDENVARRVIKEPADSEVSLRHARPRRPRADRLKWDEDLAKKLAGINLKISSLYFSVCDVDVENHAALVSVGLWSLLETLTAVAGRDPNTNFHSFIKANNRDNTLYGIDKDIPNACERILHYGNTTKHHPVAAQLNAHTIVNDWETIQVLLHNLAARAV